jgi:hypothetical protein
MPRTDRMIYWREDNGSFLPPLDENVVNREIERELQRHVSGVKAGTIISFRKMRKRHLEQVMEEDGVPTIRKKPGSEEYMTDFDSLSLLDARLRAVFGNWIPYAFSWDAISREFHGLRGFISIGRRRVPEAREMIVEAFKERRKQVDEFLKKIHAASPVKTTDDEKTLLTNLSGAIQILVRGVMGETDCDDHWYGGVEENADLYLESLGCFVRKSEVEEITEKHFESWVEPSEDEVVRFADELAAIGVRKLFESRYGK